MSDLWSIKRAAVGVAIAIGLVAAYVNNQQYGHGASTQADVKVDRSMSDVVPLPPDLWPRR